MVTPDPRRGDGPGDPDIVPGQPKPDAPQRPADPDDDEAERPAGD